MNKLAFFIWLTAICELGGILMAWFFVKPEFRGEPIHLCLLYFAVGFTPVFTFLMSYICLPNETSRNR
jgi:hypothetical protein